MVRNYLAAQIDWNAALAKYGLVGVTLLALGAFLYYKVWPIAQGQWEETQKARRARMDLADKILLDNAEHSRQMMNTTIKEFGDALRESNRESRSVVDQLRALTNETKNIADHVETLTNEVRRNQ